MAATYTYRSGAAPTVVDTLTEVTREIGTSAQQRLQGSAYNSIPEIRPTVAWTSDTNADEYTGVCVLDGNGIVGTRQEFAIFGYGALGSGATITAFPIVMEAKPLAVDLQSTGKGDVSVNFVQHGDTVALGFNALGITYT